MIDILLLILGYLSIISFMLIFYIIHKKISRILNLLSQSIEKKDNEAINLSENTKYKVQENLNESNNKDTRGYRELNKDRKEDKKNIVIEKLKKSENNDRYKKNKQVISTTKGVVLKNIIYNNKIGYTEPNSYNLKTKMTNQISPSIKENNKTITSKISESKTNANITYRNKNASLFKKQVQLNSMDKTINLNIKVNSNKRSTN